MGRRPLRFVDDAMSSLLTRAAYNLSLPFMTTIEKHGMSSTEWRIMATLSEGDGLTIGQLADSVMAKQPTVSKIIDRMTKAGWVQRLPGKIDKRHTTLYTTKHGKELVQHLLQLHHQTEARVLQQFSAEETMELKAILRRLIAGKTESAEHQGSAGTRFDSSDKRSDVN